MTDTAQVIEFQLGDERYCIGIDFVSEVVRVDREQLTLVPNSPRYVEGVVDLRGETTTVINPYEVLDIDGRLDTFGQMLVFDKTEMGDEAVGWLVDDVYRVSNIEETAIEESPADRAGIRGVVNRDDGFVIWTSPDRALG
ncbi:MAG: chemotaxis protein CheW [Halobacteriales archaeon]